MTDLAPIIYTLLALFVLFVCVFGDRYTTEG
jgi:hypothetical protein